MDYLLSALGSELLSEEVATAIGQALLSIVPPSDDLKDPLWAIVKECRAAQKVAARLACSDREQFEGALAALSVMATAGERILQVVVKLAPDIVRMARRCLTSDDDSLAAIAAEVAAILLAAVAMPLSARRLRPTFRRLEDPALKTRLLKAVNRAWNSLGINCIAQDEGIKDLAELFVEQIEMGDQEVQQAAVNGLRSLLHASAGPQVIADVVGADTELSSFLASGETFSVAELQVALWPLPLAYMLTVEQTWHVLGNNWLAPPRPWSWRGSWDPSSGDSQRGSWDPTTFATFTRRSSFLYDGDEVAQVSSLPRASDGSETSVMANEPKTQGSLGKKTQTQGSRSRNALKHTNSMPMPRGYTPPRSVPSSTRLSLTPTQDSQKNLRTSLIETHSPGEWTSMSVQNGLTQSQTISHTDLDTDHLSLSLAVNVSSSLAEQTSDPNSRLSSPMSL